MDEAIGQPSLCEGSEYIHGVLEEGSLELDLVVLHGCDVVDTKQSEVSSGELLAHIQRPCQEEIPRTPKVHLVHACTTQQDHPR